MAALGKVHLRALAAAVVGDYFPGKTPKQLAAKTHLCAGAQPQLHSHFFTRDGSFGSLDQNGSQVDNGVYRVINNHVLSIGSQGLAAVNFDYHISHNELTLVPNITTALRRQALAHPLVFSAAGWAVAVSYLGHTWHRVACPNC